MLLKNIGGQLVQVGSLLNSSNVRLLTGATVRWCKDGTWANGAGTLSVEETDQWKYTPTQAETNCSFWAAAIDHASAVQPIVKSGRTISNGPVEHTPVGTGRILQARDRQDGGLDITGPFVMHTLNGAGEELWWAIDLKNQLAIGQLIDSMAAPTVTGAQASHMTITQYGVFGTLVKFFAVLDPAALSSDDITANFDISPVADEHLLLSATPEVQNY